MENTGISISVVMGVYNQKYQEELNLAVNSILGQSFSEFEFLIFDDGSKEEEAVCLEQLAARDARIKLKREEENHGLAYALNQCIKEAKGEYIARMDADDLSKPDRFLRQKQFLDMHPEYAWVGCNAELINKNGVWGHQKMQEIPTERDFLRYSPYIHPAVMFRKEALEAVGGYRISKETLRCEDYDLFMRLHLAGYRGYNLQQEYFSYREHRSAYLKRGMKARLQESRLRFRNFRKMGLLNAEGIFYVIKPILGGAIPPAVHYRLRRFMTR